MKSNTLVISLHDVSPQTQAIVTQQLEELHLIGITRCSLLVIPDYHHHFLISQFPSFVTWLEEQAHHGHEIVLHGYHHLRAPSTNDRASKRLMTEFYTAGEGEFYDLDYEQASRLLKMGKGVLQQAGCDTSQLFGFIAPAWLLAKEAEHAVADEGFLYTTRLKGIIDLRKKPSRFFPSQSMVYSVRSAWRRIVSLIWNELLFQYATYQKWPLLRVSLHPVDWKYPSIQSHLLYSIKRAMKDRTPMTYESWLRSV
jgi:predicted deacetylase